MVHELTPRLLDAISGTGEMLAAPLVAARDSPRAGAGPAPSTPPRCIVTTDQFGGAEPLMDETRVKTQANGCGR